jgi:hypothetical protein
LYMPPLRNGRVALRQSLLSRSPVLGVVLRCPAFSPAVSRFKRPGIKGAFRKISPLGCMFFTRFSAFIAFVVLVFCYIFNSFFVYGCCFQSIRLSWQGGNLLRAGSLSIAERISI